MKQIWFILLILFLAANPFDQRSGLCQSDTSFSPLDKIKTYQNQLETDSTRIEIRLKLAKTYLQVEGYTNAVAEYSQVISTVENDAKHLSILADGYYGLGLAYSGLEKFKEAIQEFQNAIQYTPNRAHIHAALGSAHASLHQYEDALEAYLAANKLSPSDAMIHHQLGNIYSKRGKRKEAIYHQEKVIAMSPNMASAHYQLGLLYTQENRLSDAIAAYESAYEIDPERIEALYNLAQVHRRKGNVAESRKKMEVYEKRKVEVKPIQNLRGALQRTQEQSKRARIFANIGRLYIKSKMYVKAVREYEKALALSPNLVEAHNGIGIAYIMLKQYTEAIESQLKALSINPNFAEAHAGLGLAYLRKNQVELSLKHYRKAISLSNKKPKFEEEAYYKIASIQLEREQYSEAIESFKAVISLNTKHVGAYHNLGLCYAHQDKTEDALYALNKAVETNQKQQVANTDDSEFSQKRSPFLPETYYLIGELHTKQAKYDEAKSAYLASGLPKAYNALAQLSAKHAASHEQTSQRFNLLDSALSYAETAIQLDPKKASYHNTHALIAFSKKDYNTAEASIRKAIELNPTNQNYQEGLKQIQMIKSQQ